MSVKPSSPLRFWLWLAACSAALLTVMLLAGRVLDNAAFKKPLPIYSTLGRGLTALERSGQTVSLAELRGKVFTCAYIYTVCPHGCAAVMGEMMKLHKRHGSHADFHQVSIAVAPERDTPAFLQSYALGLGLTPEDHWWFLTGDQKQLWRFMDEDLKLAPAKPIPAEERLNPLDLYNHDLRIVLVDRQGRVRGYYAVFHTEREIAELMCERLQRDTQMLLDNPNL